MSGRLISAKLRRLKPELVLLKSIQGDSPDLEPPLIVEYMLTSHQILRVRTI